MPLIHECLKKYCIAFIVLSLCALAPVASGMRQQAVGARGRLHCGNVPASNIKIKLMDKDTGIDPDDELAATYTDADGKFELQGDTRELTNIDPQLKIYHQCNKGLNVFEIPDKYITSGTHIPKRIFDLGDVNLEVEIEGQSFDCIH